MKNMKFKLAIAVLATFPLLTGCAGATIGLRSTHSPSMERSAPQPGSYSYGSAAIQADVRPNAFFGTMFLGYMMTGIQDDYLSWGSGPAWRKPPQMAEGRAIVERDCSRPMEAPSANLRCK